METPFGIIDGKAVGNSKHGANANTAGNRRKGKAKTAKPGRNSSNRSNVESGNLWISDSGSMFLPQQLQPSPLHQSGQSLQPTQSMQSLQPTQSMQSTQSMEPGRSQHAMSQQKQQQRQRNEANRSRPSNKSSNKFSNKFKYAECNDQNDDEDDEMESLLKTNDSWDRPPLERTSLVRVASTSSTASTPVLDNSNTNGNLDFGDNRLRKQQQHHQRQQKQQQQQQQGLPRQRKRDRQKQRRRRRRRSKSEDSTDDANINIIEMDGDRNNRHVPNDQPSVWRYCCFFCFCCWRNLFPHSRQGARRCCDQTIVRSTLFVMNILAKIVMWSSMVALCVAVVWYSYELKNNGTDPHLVAWFSAGAFVLLGFPISIFGIISHLANYNQPSVQCYVVRILWMVPIYSIESWLCLRFHRYAIYIETLRDCYESYVLYSFLQFLIQVLGGEEALILMLKDKSPTRGVHMWGLQWFVKPWLMGQPVRKTYQSTSRTHNDNRNDNHNNDNRNANHNDNYNEFDRDQPYNHRTSQSSMGDGDAIAVAAEAVATTFRDLGNDLHVASSNKTTASQSSVSQNSNRALKRVHWSSPFFVYCKFGVLQYVLLKIVCSIVVVILERYGLYKEGNFTPQGGYLYICILTNLSQCWALYCLIFFYYATKNELGSIRPVGKFLAVKSLVFFTWWQSVCISILYQMDLIPHYRASSFAPSGLGEDDGMTATVFTPSDFDVTSGGVQEQAALAFDQHGGKAIGQGPTEWTPEDVAKGMQDYLICIEMFIAAIVHTFVFPHLEYSVEAVEARSRALNQTPHKHWNKRLGRKWKEWDNKSGFSLGTLSTFSEKQQLHQARQQVLPLLSTPERHADGSFLQPRPHGPAHEEELELVNRHRIDSIDADDYLMNHPMDRLQESNTQPSGDEETGDGGPQGSDVDTVRRQHLEATSVAGLDSEFSGAEEFVSLASSANFGDDSQRFGGNDEDDDDDDGDYDESSSGSEGSREEDSGEDIPLMPNAQKPNFVRALLDSTIPQDLRDNTVGIIKGDYIVERKTLLHHAATSDSYDLFSRVMSSRKPQQPPSDTLSESK